jgi:hypothetical protein
MIAIRNGEKRMKAKLRGTAALAIAIALGACGGGGGAAGGA